MGFNSGFKGLISYTGNTFSSEWNIYNQDITAVLPKCCKTAVSLKPTQLSTRDIQDFPVQWRCFEAYFWIQVHTKVFFLSQWTRGIRSRSAVARLVRMWVSILPEAWMSVCWDSCVLSVRSLCGELITRPEESYRMWCVFESDPEASWMRRPWPTGGCGAQ